MAADSDLIRLQQILRLVAKEDHHLQAVRNRFMPNGVEIDIDWLQATLDEDIGVDRLESFSAKFARMQDTVIDKLLPQLLKAAGETPMAAIDNLNRAERLGFIADADTWLQMRRLRNRLVHEYFESLDEMIPALKQAEAFTRELHNAAEAMADYAVSHLGVRREAIRADV
jgi:hypothetical protein